VILRYPERGRRNSVRRRGLDAKGKRRAGIGQREKQAIRFLVKDVQAVMGEVQEGERGCYETR
jgi:hypothetical protein